MQPLATCTRCGAVAIYCRVPHRRGCGWQLAVWCIACCAHADPRRPWLPKRTLSRPELGELVRTGREADDHEQLKLAIDFARAAARS